MTRTIQRRGCTVNLADRPKLIESAPHMEMLSAWHRDQSNKRFSEQLAEDLAHELDLDLSGLPVGGERT